MFLTRCKAILAVAAMTSTAVVAQQPESTVPVAPQPAPAVAPAAGAELGAKKPGVKRIGVVTTGSKGEDVRPALLELLQGDGSMLEAVPLTAKMDAFRIAEAKKKECDYMLTVTVDIKPAGDPSGWLKKGLDVTKTANMESLYFKNKDATVQQTDKQTDSVGRVAAKLTPTGKEKVRFTYALSAPGSTQPVLSQTKEVASAEMNSVLEKFLNDVVNQALKP